MSHPTGITANAFTAPAEERLAAYLARKSQPNAEIIPPTPDASTRVYFRVPWPKGTAIAAVYP